MKSLLLAGLGLVAAVSSAFATAVVPPPIPPPRAPDPGTLSIDAFTSGVQATIFRNDGTQSGAVNALLTQMVVTYHNSDGTPVTLDTFCIDLFHTVSPDQVYPVILRGALDPVFLNGDRMRYILEHFGASDLSGVPDQAAAVQIALWDLSLNNHNPTSFGPDPGSTYSSGDPSVFSVDFGSNPDASAIAASVNQHLVASEGRHDIRFLAGRGRGRQQRTTRPEPSASAAIRHSAQRSRHRRRGAAAPVVSPADCRPDRGLPDAHAPVPRRRADGQRAPIS